MKWTVPSYMWKDGDVWILGGGYSVLEQLQVPEQVQAAIYSKQLGTDALTKYFKPLFNKHVIGINAVGDDGTNEFGGCSMAADPSGKIIVEADETSELVLEVNL